MLRPQPADFKADLARELYEYVWPLLELDPEHRDSVKVRYCLSWWCVLVSVFGALSVVS